MMHIILRVSLLSAACTAIVSAQTPPATVRLTVDDAVRMALDHNVDLGADRLDPQISDAHVAAAARAFRPTITSSMEQNNQLLPPTNLLLPLTTSTKAFTSSAGLSQRLPRFGTTYSVGWSAVRTGSNGAVTSYDPLLQSWLVLNVSQPLVRDFSIDASRQQLATSRVNRDIADARVRESIVHTTSEVRTAYWNLASTIATVEARRSVLDLAQELVRVNKAKVDVGSSPPLDLVSAQAEVAADQEQLIIAETAVKQAEDRLRLLIYDASDRAVWSLKLELTDSPPTATIAPDLEAAVTTALRERADLARARKDIENSRSSVTFARGQRLPDVRLNASYQASGIGGTQVLRSGGFPGTIVGPGNVIAFGSVLNQLFVNKYPTWTAGVSVSYPLGSSVEDANYVRATIEQSQTEQRLKSAEARAIQQVRDAGWQLEMNTKRIETTRAARDLAEQRLDAERKRFEVGMSPNFLVIQAQRDLAQARTNELSAVLAYDLALVNFEALQQAGPAQAGAAPASTGTATAAAPPASVGAAAATTVSTGGITIPGLSR